VLQGVKNLAILAMPVPDPVLRKDREMVDQNALSSALCDMIDVRNALSKTMKNRPKDNEGTEITIGMCLDDVILFLESLEEGEAE
jgi:hypothetical protein